MAFTYDDQPHNNVGDAVRFLIGDTDDDATSKHISDNELIFILQRHGFASIGTSYSNANDQTKILQMALEAARALVTKYASEAHYAIGGMNESANQKAMELRKRIRELERLVARTVRPRFMGQSQAAKTTAAGDSDLIQSAFARGMFENSRVDYG